MPFKNSLAIVLWGIAQCFQPRYLEWRNPHLSKTAWNKVQRTSIFLDFMIPLKFEHLQVLPPGPPQGKKPTKNHRRESVVKNQGAVFVAGEPQVSKRLRRKVEQKTQQRKCEIPLTRWFNPWPLYPPIWRSLNLLKGSRFHHLKKVTRNCQGVSFCKDPGMCLGISPQILGRGLRLSILLDRLRIIQSSSYFRRIDQKKHQNTRLCILWIHDDFQNNPIIWDAKKNEPYSDLTLSACWIGIPMILWLISLVE